MSKVSKNFYGRLFEEIKPLLTFPEDIEQRKKLTERIHSHLLGERLPDDHLPIRKISPQEKYLGTLLREYTEIKSSLERISMARAFLSRNQRIFSDVEYVRYHYESYLNELYVFYLRINHLLDFLLKKCKKLELNQETEKIIKTKHIIGNALYPVIKKRGEHVHVKRYKNDKLDQLIGLESLGAEFKFLDDLKKQELKDLKNKMITEMNDSEEALEYILETFIYKQLGSIVFTKLKILHKGNK